MDTRSRALCEAQPATPFGILEVHGFTATDTAPFQALVQQELAQAAPRFDSYLRADFVKTEPICHYVKFYKHFKKTYFVLQQLESIFVKRQPFPQALPAIACLFLTELKHHVLVAACDLACVQQPYEIDFTPGGETFIGASGAEITTKPGDLVVRDGGGVILSDIYGQDQRTRVHAQSRELLYFVLGVEGVRAAAMEAALDDLERYVRTLSPDAGITKCLLPH